MIYCPLCGREIPEEDRDVMRPPDRKLVAQVQCRLCGKVFTICEETEFLKIRIMGKKNHPEN
jgi:endogenous inhibitor of DNA gyrase (YacG/DUF329 family)